MRASGGPKDPRYPGGAFERLVRAKVMPTLGPVVRASRRRFGAVIDWRLHLDTWHAVELDELGVAGEDRNAYEPSRWSALPRILPRDEVCPGDVFVDFGSGKGRVVYQAAHRYPFKRVIGVEISEELNRTARANIERNRHRLRCQDVQLITSDVLDYQIPDDTTFAYLFNPVRGKLLSAVIERLLASVDAHPRPLRVIYWPSFEEQRLLESGRFELIRANRLALRPGRAWAKQVGVKMYRALPPVPKG